MNIYFNIEVNLNYIPDSMQIFEIRKMVLIQMNVNCTMCNVQCACILLFCNHFHVKGAFKYPSFMKTCVILLTTVGL